MFVMVFVWIGFNIYHAWATSTISADLALQIVPIKPNFDINTIHVLKNRNSIAPLFDSATPVTETPEASPAATILLPALPISPAASLSAEPSTLTPTINPTIQP